MRVKFNEEGLREELREALLIVPRTRGQLDGFASSGSSDSRFTRHSHYDITDDNGKKIASVKAPVVTTLACRQFKQSPCPLPPRAFVYARLLRDMNSNSEPISDWLRYCYSEGAQMPTKTLLLALLDEFYKQESKNLGKDSKKLIAHLALLACQQKRERINGGTLLLSQVVIAEKAGKKISAWEKSWAKRWTRLLNILAQFDKEGLEHVYECRRRTKATGRNADLPVQSVLRAAARAYVAA
ncbi:bacteriophage antitermination protein Q [Vibrio parahaemolyticus]|nr:bacteriophage antitermination protein Q [Vibrio parahaemolyticus]